jgi:hypothetical protein
VISVSTTEVSDVTTSSSSGGGQNKHVPIRKLKDNNGLLHHQVRFPITVGKNGKKSTLTRFCKLCKDNQEKKSIFLASTVSLKVKQIPFAAPISLILSKIASKNRLKT